MRADKITSYRDSTSFLQYTVIGGSFSIGDLLLVFLNPSKSVGLRRKSDIALTGVMKFLSKDDFEKSTLTLLALEAVKTCTKWFHELTKNTKTVALS